MLVEENSVMVEEREREIRQVVQSISDLNEIFRDLAGMVVEQVWKEPSCFHDGYHHYMIITICPLIPFQGNGAGQN